LSTPKAIGEVVSDLIRLKGVIAVQPLGHGEVETITELEMRDNRESRAVGNVENEGVLEVARRQIVLALAHGPEFRHPPCPILFWKMGDQIVGEEILTRDRLEELRRRKDTIFLGERMVLYRDRMKQAASQILRCIYPPVPFPELEKQNRVRDVVSATVSITADGFLKEKMNLDRSDPKIGTILIGFNEK